VSGLNWALNEQLSDEADAIRYLADPPVVFQGTRKRTGTLAGCWSRSSTVTVPLNGIFIRGQRPQ